MEEKYYSTKELNEMIGYIDKSGTNSTQKTMLTRCKNAGLEIEAIPTPKGSPNKYKIIQDNFHLDGEEWIDCIFNSDWEVSNLGRIRRKITKKLMGSKDDKTGYVRVCMVDPITHKTTNISLNRAIFFSFNPDLLKDQEHIQIDHINGIRTDNSLINLRALSNIENTKQRDNNQAEIKTVISQLITKYGYEKTKELLNNLL